MSAVSSLRDLFSRQAKGRAPADSDLAALARFILLESAEKKSGTTYVSDAELDNKNKFRAGKEALTLLSLWNEGGSMPKTFRVLLDALLEAWVSSFIDAKLEKDIVDALLALDELDEKEKGQLEEALRMCGKEHLYYQPQKLLRILTGAGDASNDSVVKWAFKTLGSKVNTDHLRFVAICLSACGESSDNASKLEGAAKYHIQVAAKTLTVAENMSFADVRGGPFRPMGRASELTLHTSTLVEYVWVTSKMNETLKKSAEGANAWLNAAERQALERMGAAEKRSFDIKLTVKIYPHEKDWYSRRSELEPLQTLSHTV